MNHCLGEAELIQQLQSLEAQFSKAIVAGNDACNPFFTYLQNTLSRAHHLVQSGQSSHQLPQVFAGAVRSLNAMCGHLAQAEQYLALNNQADKVQEIMTRAGFRRRRKRSTRSRKSKAGKNGRVRQSGKKSKRGRKSPVGNPKRRVRVEDEAAGSTKQSQTKRKPTFDSNGKKCRTVTAPPTDSMKFGPCRDFFLSHLGDPYPTTVQKHQILKQSSPDFTLRSLNLWFVNIRRRSKWMDIFKKHAGSKRDAMRDLVARVEAQVAGRPAPNPLPSGAAPPGFKVEQEIVDEVMAMRAVVDMVSREVYGEGWDQILQIKPWSEEEVRAHEERKKMARREARAAKADGEKRRKEREERREQRRRDKETRKRVEQEAVDGIRAARELHAKLMSANKRKRDEDEESVDGPSKRSKKGSEVGMDENGQPKKTKVRVPKFDEQGNPLTKEQRKALKKAMLAAQVQVNPLKRKSPELAEPNSAHSTEAHAFDDVSPSKRRRRDAVAFDGFPSSEDAPEGAPMPDLSQLFSLEWASPPPPAAPVPVDNTPPPAPNPSYGEFAHPSDNQAAPMPPPAPMDATSSVAAGEVPRRFSQQLAAFALESGMFDGENYQLFNEDTFPGIAVDVHTDNGMGSLMPPPHAPASMSVSPAQNAPHTPIPGFATPIQPQGYDSFAPPQNTHPHGHTPPSPYSNASTITPNQGNTDMDSDMSWINAAIAQLPSEHDVQHQQMHAQYHHASGSQEPMQHTPQPTYSQTYVSEPSSYGPGSFAPASDRRAPVSHQRTQVSYPSPQPQPQRSMPPPPPPSASPVQSRQSFPHPKSRPSAPQPSLSTSPQRQRAPGGLWQTPYSQPAQPQQQHQYQQAPPSFPSPAASRPPSRSFPAPQPHHVGQPQYNDPGYERHNGYAQPEPSPSERGHEHDYQQHAPIYPPPQSQYAPSPSPVAEPAPDPVAILKQHELEFARAQEELQNRFKREQEEQLARFMRAQEDLRKRLLSETGRS
ncbi:hypothetical protein FRC06_004206 [Ceratobasidium sp. 370]|nr:hypothetical protein FRC06_004206 [Ceratobasidium sp. 370]